MVISLLLLFISLALLLQVPKVQLWAVTKVSEYLNHNSSFRTQIGGIRLNWWDALSLEQVAIYDSHDSLMLGADQVYADFSLLSLLPPGETEIDQLRSENLKVHLIAHPGDSSLNINLWLNEISTLLKGPEKTPSTARFEVNSIELRHSSFAYSDLRARTVPEG